MVEVANIGGFSAEIKEFVPISSLVLNLRHMFSLENLVIDYSLVMNMNADLWVSLSFVRNLESIRLVCRDDYELYNACMEAGLEISGDYVRKRVEIPRRNLYVRSSEEICKELEGLEYESSKKEDKGYVVCCYSESQAISNMLELRRRGVSCEIDYVNPYVYLLDKVLKFVKNGSFIAVNYLFAPAQTVAKVYSLDELKEIYKRSKLSLPDSYHNHFHTGLIAKLPTKIATLTN